MVVLKLVASSFNLYKNSTLYTLTYENLENKI